MSQQEIPHQQNLKEKLALDSKMNNISRWHFERVFLLLLSCFDEKQNLFISFSELNNIAIYF